MTGPLTQYAANPRRRDHWQVEIRTLYCRSRRLVVHWRNTNCILLRTKSSSASLFRFVPLVDPVKDAGDNEEDYDVPKAEPSAAPAHSAVPGTAEKEASQHAAR